MEVEQLPTDRPTTQNSSGSNGGNKMQWRIGTEKVHWGEGIVVGGELGERRKKERGQGYGNGGRGAGGGGGGAVVVGRRRED